MQVTHFPDDPPPRWHQPVLALGNFDGLHRGHMKIIDRVRRRAGERGGTPAAMTFDPAPAARRPARQGAAAADDRRAEARSAGAVRACRASRSCASPASCRTGSRRRSSGRCSSSGCTSPKCGSARTSCSATIAPATSRCCAASAPATASAPRRSIRSATRTSWSAARACAGCVSEGRVDEAGALLGHHYFIDGVVVRGAGRGREHRVSRPPTSQTENELLPPSGRLCDDGRPSTASCYRVGDQHRHAADVRRRRPPGDRDAHLRLRSRISTIAACGCRSCSGCATSGRFPTSTRCARRSRPTAAARAGCSAAFRCRIVIYARARPADALTATRFDLRLSVPAEGDLRAIAGRAGRQGRRAPRRRLRPTRSRSAHRSPSWRCS